MENIQQPQDSGQFAHNPSPHPLMRFGAGVGIFLMLLGVSVAVYISLDSSKDSAQPTATDESWRPELERWLQEASEETSEGGGMSSFGEKDPKAVRTMYPAFKDPKGLYDGYYTNLSAEEGVTWLKDPEYLVDAELVASMGAEWYDQSYDLQYYKIGEDNGHDIIATFLPCDGLCIYSAEALLVFRGVPNGYEVLASHTERFNERHLEFPVTVSVNYERTYAALKAPSTITEKGELLSGAYLDGFFENMEVRANTDPQFKEDDLHYRVSFVTDTPNGPLFRQSFQRTDSRMSVDHFVLRLPGGIAYRYYERPQFIGDDRVPQITWTDGSKNSDAYRSDGLSSCGGWGSVEVVSDEHTDSLQNELVPVGYTSTSRVIFAPTDPHHWLVERVFEMTNGQNYVYDQTTGENYVHTYTYEEYHTNHGVVLYKDGFGKYVALVNMRFGPAAECAKPVIYLYPEATTTVSVRVGATVTKSDPLYNDGWIVDATPHGILSFNDTQYESLYWDGYGQGTYPTITKGVVVERDEVAHTIALQMYRMGFVQNEIEDFLEYWMPLMPQSPYVRLSWLGTQEMEELAPLAIEPHQKTLLRAFLDFEGLDRFEEWEPQRFTPVDRDGFTVVEWGGLRRSQ